MAEIVKDEGGNCIGVFPVAGKDVNCGALTLST
jgi:hypothetical protein